MPSKASKRLISLSCILLAGILPGAFPLAQQAADLQAPSPPQGFAVPPLPEEPLVYDTGEGHQIRVVVVARALNHPYSIAFLPGGTALVTEKNAGQLRIIRDNVLDPRPVGGLPEVVANDFGGLLDLALHPRFEDTRLLYFSYNKPLADGGSAVAVGRGRWDGRDLSGVEDIYVAEPGTSAGSRIAFGADAHLYVTLSGPFGMAPQQADTVRGKVLRLTEDGGIPADNPFIDKAGYKPEIYSLGHRSPSGLAIQPVTGEMWELEMGPNGGDEINILKPGANYGWPLVSTGRDYAGPWQAEDFNNVSGMEDPVVYWMPSISVSGMAFYYGDRFPDWHNNLFVGGLRTGEIPGTGLLQRIHLNENLQEIRRENLLVNLRQRIRDVKVSPDGHLYVLTDADDGAVLRIEPHRDGQP